jgi:hypothetical protein
MRIQSSQRPLLASCNAAYACAGEGEKRLVGRVPTVMVPTSVVPATLVLTMGMWSEHSASNTLCAAPLPLRVRLS